MTDGRRSRPAPGPAAPAEPVAAVGVDADPPLPVVAVVVGLVAIGLTSVLGAFLSVLLTPFRIGTVLVPVAVVLAVAVNLVLPRLAYALTHSRGAAALPVVLFFGAAWSPTLVRTGDVLLPGGSTWQTTIGFGVLLLGMLAGVVTAVRARSPRDPATRRLGDQAGSRR